MANPDNGNSPGRPVNSSTKRIRSCNWSWIRKRKQDDMGKRFASIYFPYLLTDWFSIQKPVLYGLPFVIAAQVHGRLVITAINAVAAAAFIHTGMVVADARAIFPSLVVQDEPETKSATLLRELAEYCIRWTPLVSSDLPAGLTLDVTGCAHLWGGEQEYLRQILSRFTKMGYTVRAAIADTIASARGLARFGAETQIIGPGLQKEALLPLPVQALDLEAEHLERLEKLGLRRINSIIDMPRPALRRRFGREILTKIDQALGKDEELFEPVVPLEAYQERLPCLEPIQTATGIEIALQQLLKQLCERLQHEQKGLRVAIFKCFRIDGKLETVQIGTNRGSHNAAHLLKLFEDRITLIEPALGIELFLLEAIKTEDLFSFQKTLWQGACGLEDTRLTELVDRLTNRVGENAVHRYLPAAHHWPERSLRLAHSFEEKLPFPWLIDKPRPVMLLPQPELIEVTAPVPDYPPMNFRYQGHLHKVKKADGPERIEREWWIEEGQHRDYYCVENEEGARYWLFRSGHYSAEKNYQWFIHGLFP